jgi:hypothetical protein
MKNSSNASVTLRNGFFKSTSVTATVILSLASPVVLGCDVPVFRYALDRWPADVFRLQASAAVLSAEPLAKEFRNLSSSGTLNLETSVSTNGTKLFFPVHVKNADAPEWQGQLTPDIYHALTDSPVRREVVKRILNGDSAVWILVESGRPELDEPAAKLLQNRLKFLESATGLPHLDPTDPDSQLGPGPELKVQFSLLRVKRTDQKEQEFLSLLAGPAGLQKFAADQPFFAAVFGRGRVLGAWGQDRLNEEFVVDTARFLLGSCSCEVKSLNPGWDLLLRVDWEEELRKVGAARTGGKGPDGQPFQPQTVIIRPDEN